MGTKGSRLLLLANREGFLEEVASEPPLERETERMLRLDRNGRWARLMLAHDYPTIPRSSVNDDKWKTFPFSRLVVFPSV